MSNVVVDTPYYVLMNDKRRIGPNVVQPECLPIYGFSDKEHYDKFCLDSKLELTPYPLGAGIAGVGWNWSLVGLQLARS